jgi:hypothetical protein
MLGKLPVTESNQGLRMATYREIQNWVRAANGFVPKTSWIAHVKADCGLSERAASNRFNHPTRVNACPITRRAAIEAAFRHFGMVGQQRVLETASEGGG